MNRSVALQEKLCDRVIKGSSDFLEFDSSSLDFIHLNSQVRESCNLRRSTRQVLRHATTTSLHGT